MVIFIEEASFNILSFIRRKCCEAEKSIYNKLVHQSINIYLYIGTYNVYEFCMQILYIYVSGTGWIFRYIKIASIFYVSYKYMRVMCAKYEHKKNL